MEAAAPPWLRPILTVAVGTGMRLGEVVGLTWDNYDKESALFYVSEDNRTATPRAVPVGDKVREVLDRQVRHVRSAYTFLDSTGQP